MEGILIGNSVCANVRSKLVATGGFLEFRPSKIFYSSVILTNDLSPKKYSKIFFNAIKYSNIVCNFDCANCSSLFFWIAASRR